MPLGIDATIRYGLDVPADRVDARVAARAATTPYNTRKLHGAAADADREPRASPRSRRPRIPAKVDYLYFVRKPDQKHHFFTASEREFDQLPARRPTAIG